MAVEVKLPTILRTHSGGAPVVKAVGGSVEQVLSDLEARYPGLTRSIRSEDGGLKRFVNVYVNDEDIRFTGSLEARVGDGDVVSIVPAVAGG